MKKYILLSVSVLLAAVGNAQVWQGTGSTGNNATGEIFRTGNVGIGTTVAPSAKLQVVGGGGATIDLIVSGRMQSADNAVGGLWCGATAFVGKFNNNNIGFFNNGAWRFVVDNNGNVGIGNTRTLSERLYVESNNDVAYINVATINTQNKRTRINFSRTNPATGINTLGMEIGTDYNFQGLDNIYIFNRTNNQISTIFDGATGNVGIGTTYMPTEKLEVVGNIKVSGGLTGGTISLSKPPAGDGACGWISVGRSDAVGGAFWSMRHYDNTNNTSDPNRTATQNQLQFVVYANNSWRPSPMSLTTKGQVLVNTNTPPTNDNTKLAVSGDALIRGALTANQSSYSAVPASDGACGWVSVGRSDAVGGAYWSMRHYDNTNNTADPNRAATQNQLQFVVYANNSWRPSPMSLTTKGQVLVNTNTPPTNDNTKLAVSGDAVVSGNIVNGGADFILGLNDGRPNAANVQPANMRALSHTNWRTVEKNELILNVAGDYTGGTIVDGNKMYVTGNLGIGIGTSESPKERLHVNGNVLVSGEIKSNFVISSFRTPDAGNFAGSINIGALDPANTSPSTWMMANVATLNKTMDKVVFARWSPTTWTNAMSLHKDGQVVIGSGDLPSAASCLKLYVDGTAGAKEVRVSQATWCDYVFDENYQLKPLEEVEAFIKANKHLPEIPSEKEVVDNGMGLGEMSKMHMKKIEELTLYMIELKKQNDKLTTELEALKALVNNK